MEAEVEVDQLHHRLEVVVGVLERCHPLAGHPGAHHLVMVEGDPPVDERPGPGLADIVEEGGQPQQTVGAGLVHHRQGVGQHILVPVDRVLFEGQPGKLGEELVGQPGPDHEPEGRRWHRDHHDLVQLVTDPLGRHDGQPLMTGSDRLHQAGVGFEIQPGDETGGPEHSERVVGEGHLRVERSPESPGRQVDQAIEGIDELQVRETERHGVDGEIPSRQVVLDAMAEHHVGLPGVGMVGLRPVGGDLVALAASETPDGAEPLPLGPYRVSPSSHHRFDVVRAGVSGEVEVVLVRLAGLRLAGHDGIANRPTHQIERVAGLVEPLSQAGGRLDQRLESLGEHAAEGSAAGVGCLRGDPGTWPSVPARQPTPRLHATWGRASPGRRGGGATCPNTDPDGLLGGGGVAGGRRAGLGLVPFHHSSGANHHRVRHQRPPHGLPDAVGHPDGSPVRRSAPGQIRNGPTR